MAVDSLKLRGMALATAAALAAGALLAPSARATTTGGHHTSRPYGPVLIGGMAVLGVAREFQTEYRAPIDIGISLNGVSAPPPTRRPARGHVSAAADAVAPVALAGGSSAGAAAWPGGGGLVSALVAADTLALSDRANHAVTGSLRAAAVAAPAAAGHVVAWSDDAGLHVSWVAPGGTAGDPLTVAAVPTASFQLTAASDGHPWLTWREAGALRALQLAADGSGQRARRALIHRFGPAHSRTRIELSRGSHLAGLAVEPGGRIHLLVRVPGGVALLAPGAAPRLVARRTDPRAVIAGPGVVAVATSRVYHEPENEDGGGSSPQTMRYETLHVLAAGRVAKIRSTLDGYDSF